MPLTPSHDGQSDQEKQDSDGTDDVRHHGNQTGNVACVGPDEADDGALQVVHLYAELLCARAEIPPATATEDRARWDICLKTATAMSELCEPRGVADCQYVWFMTRSFYKSDIPTGDPPDSLGYEECGADAD